MSLRDLRQQRRLEQGLRKWTGDIFQLQRRPSPEIVSATQLVQDGAVSSGVGVYGNDYLVDLAWGDVVALGNGFEGQVLTTIHGKTFKIYSDLPATIADIITRTDLTIATVGLVPNPAGYTNVTWPAPSETAGVVRIVIKGLVTVGGFSQSFPTPILPLPSWKSGPSVTAAIEFNFDSFPFPERPVDIELSDLRFGEDATASAGAWDVNIPAPGVGPTGEFLRGKCERVYFGEDAGIQVSTGFFDWVDCVFGENVLIFGHPEGSMQDVRFLGCSLFSAQFQLADSERVEISDCLIQNSSIALHGNLYTNIHDNIFEGTSAEGSGNFIFYEDLFLFPTPAGARPVRHLNIVGNQFCNGPSDTSALIRIQNTGDPLQGQHEDILIVGNSFEAPPDSPLVAATCYIRLEGVSAARIKRAIIANNTFAPEVVTAGGVTVIGRFLEDSILGPNVPHDDIIYDVTNGVQNLYIPSSTSPAGGGGISVESITKAHAHAVAVR